MLKRSIASYSFHGSLRDGSQDMFGYIADSQRLEMSQLDPWVGHLAPIVENDRAIKTGGAPFRDTLDDGEIGYLARVKAAADAANLPVGCVAVDGAHIYLDDAAARAGHRAVAYRWINAAKHLGAAQIRIDCGGSAEMPDAEFDIIIAGYHDLMARTQDAGLELILENHFGASAVPANVARIIAEVDGLGLLYDTHNWAAGLHAEGATIGAPLARSVHLKTFHGGDETGIDDEIKVAVDALLTVDYNGCWGVESIARNGDEYAAVDAALELLRTMVKQ